MFGLSCRAHCHAVGFLLPRTLSSTCIRLGGCGDVAMVWVSSDLYSSSVFRLLTWYRPVSARSEQCGTEADMRAGAAHKRDVLPHSISGLRSIRWLAPWARTRAVVIGWAQRLGARWHSGRQLLGSEAEQNEYNRNINLGACGSSARAHLRQHCGCVDTSIPSCFSLPVRSPRLRTTIAAAASATSSRAAATAVTAKISHRMWTLPFAAATSDVAARHDRSCTR